MEMLTMHDIRMEYFNLQLHRYRLSFDDGLFSQFYYFPLLQQHAQKFLFFIIPNLIHPGPARSPFAGEYIPYLKSKKYMYRTVTQNTYDHFMRIEELQELAKTEGVQIELHSHFHDVILTRTHAEKRKPLSQWKLHSVGYPTDPMDQKFSIRSKLAFQGYFYQNGTISRRSKDEWLDYIKYDTEKGLNWFDTHLGFIPDTYGFPFSEHNRMVIDILKTFGLKHFYSARPGTCTDVHGRTNIDYLLRGYT